MARSVCIVVFEIKAPRTFTVMKTDALSILFVGLSSLCYIPLSIIEGTLELKYRGVLFVWKHGYFQVLFCSND